MSVQDPVRSTSSVAPDSVASEARGRPAPHLSGSHRRAEIVAEEPAISAAPSVKPARAGEALAAKGQAAEDRVAEARAAEAMRAAEDSAGLLRGRGYLPTDVVVFVYTLVAALLLIASPVEFAGRPLVAAGYVALLIGVVALRAVPRDGSPLLRFVRDWYFFICLPLFYSSIRYLNRTITLEYHDDIIVRAEQAVFGLQPSQILHKAFAFAPLSEFLHLTYLLYLILIPLVGLTLYLRSRHGPYRLFATSVLATYFFCYFFFMAFPVLGPFHYFGALPISDQATFFPRLAHGLLNQASSMGTAFPSSHVAAAVCIWMMSRRYQPLLSWVVLVIAAGIFAGTVYGGFHYALDALAGAVIGIAFGFVGPRLHLWLGRRLGAQAQEA